MHPNGYLSTSNSPGSAQTSIPEAEVNAYGGTLGVLCHNVKLLSTPQCRAALGRLSPRSLAQDPELLFEFLPQCSASVPEVLIQPFMSNLRYASVLVSVLKLMPFQVILQRLLLYNGLRSCLSAE